MALQIVPEVHGTLEPGTCMPRLGWAIRGIAVLGVVFLLVRDLSGAQVRAELNPTTVLPGEAATLTVLVENTGADSIPLVPEVPGLQVVYVGSGNSISIQNNRVSSTSSYIYRVTGLKPGTFRIPPIEVRVGGHVFHTQEVQLTVREPGTVQDAGGAARTRSGILAA